MGEPLTRRSFMKAAGAVAAGAAVGGTLASCQPSGMKNLEVDASVAGDAVAEEQEFTCTCSWSCSFCQYRIYVRNGNVSSFTEKVH